MCLAQCAREELVYDNQSVRPSGCLLSPFVFVFQLEIRRADIDETGYWGSRHALSFQFPTASSYILADIPNCWGGSYNRNAVPMATRRASATAVTKRAIAEKFRGSGTAHTVEGEIHGTKYIVQVYSGNSRSQWWIRRVENVIINITKIDRVTCKIVLELDCLCAAPWKRIGEWMCRCTWR